MIAALTLDDAQSPKESWVERQRRLWEDALARLEAALAKRKPKGKRS